MFWKGRQRESILGPRQVGHAKRSSTLVRHEAQKVWPCEQALVGLSRTSKQRVQIKFSSTGWARQGRALTRSPSRSVRRPLRLSGGGRREGAAGVGKVGAGAQSFPKIVGDRRPPHLSAPCYLGRYCVFRAVREANKVGWRSLFLRPAGELGPYRRQRRLRLYCRT
jgi:hypothetical protein